MSLIEAISEAIATMEGFFKAGTIAQRNNNPGNLRSWGSVPVVDGYAQFPTAEAGWSALHRQVGLNINRGLSLDEFFGGKPGVYGGYSPAADANDPGVYARFVAGRIGLDPSIPLNQADFSGPGDGGESIEESGAIDWTLLAVLGIGLLALWWIVD